MLVSLSGWTANTILTQPLLPLTRFQQSMIALGSVAMGAGMTINFVVVAPLARQAGLTEIQVAGILTLSTFIYALMIPTWGRLANHFGRKRVMVFSLFAMALANMAFLFALSAALAGTITGMTMFFTLVFVRFWFGLLSPGLQPASMAAMTDATTPKTRAGGLGMLGAAMSIGSIIGPAGAAVLAPFGALAPLWGSIIFCAICGTLIGVILPATRPVSRTSTRPPALRILDPRVFPHLFFLFTYFVAIGMIQQTLGWFIEDRYKDTLNLAKEDVGPIHRDRVRLPRGDDGDHSVRLYRAAQARPAQDIAHRSCLGGGWIYQRQHGRAILGAVHRVPSDWCRRSAGGSGGKRIGQPVGETRRTGVGRRIAVSRAASGFHFRAFDRRDPV